MAKVVCNVMRAGVAVATCTVAAVTGGHVGGHCMDGGWSLLMMVLVKRSTS